ncbi:MAG: Hsp20/alpha crystallin family protein [Bacillota bacterium]|nr:Hsp20/alpha crystallin family protein [Bacillota bacterium]
MMLPNVYRGFADNFFEGLFPDMEKCFAGRKEFGLMKTDIREGEEGYDLMIDMPGCAKEDVKAQVKDGYLVIEAVKGSETEEKDEAGKLIRKERYSGSMRRSFFVGDGITEDDVKAKFENGVLTLSVPKEKPALPEEPKYIAIEG